jgi:hypothetical protein
MIGASERIAIVAERKRLAAEPIPSNQKPVGGAVTPVHFAHFSDTPSTSTLLDVAAARNYLSGVVAY